MLGNCLPPSSHPLIRDTVLCKIPVRSLKNGNGLIVYSLKRWAGACRSQNVVLIENCLGMGPPKREAFTALRGVTGLNRARPAPRPGGESLAVGKTSAAEFQDSTSTSLHLAQFRQRFSQIPALGALKILLHRSIGMSNYSPRITLTCYLHRHQASPNL